jgi:hypothetical protein
VAVLLIGREVRQAVLIAPEIIERLLERVARSGHQLRALRGSLTVVSSFRSLRG